MPTTILSSLIKQKISLNRRNNFLFFLIFPNIQTQEMVEFTVLVAAAMIEEAKRRFSFVFSITSMSNRRRLDISQV